MHKSINTLIGEFRDDIEGIVRSKLYRIFLSVCEKGAPIGIKIVYTIILALFALILIPFILVLGALGFSLLFTTEYTELIKSIILGVSCISGILLLLLIVLLIIRSTVQKRFENRILTSLLDRMDAADRARKEAENEVTVYTDDVIEDIEDTPLSHIKYER